MFLIVGGLFALATAIGIGARRLRFTQCAMSLNWPSEFDADDVFRHALCYLRRSGWKIYDSWPWIGVRIRAGKDGQWLLLAIADIRLSSFDRIISDRAYSATTLGKPITVLVHGVPKIDIERVHCPKNILILAPADLSNAVDLLRAQAKALGGSDLSEANEIRMQVQAANPTPQGRTTKAESVRLSGIKM